MNAVNSDLEAKKRLKQSLFKGLLSVKFVFTMLLGLSLLISCVTLVIVKFDYQQMLEKRQQLRYQQEDLHLKHTQIVLEYNTLTSWESLSKIITQKSMALPVAENIRVIPYNAYFKNIKS